MSFWKEKPLLFLAPMDGYTDRAYREIVKAIEPRCITMCEFTSADAIAYNSKKSFEKVQFDPKVEKPYIVQLFGKNIENFQKASEYLLSIGVDGIDINMGCPAKKVVKSEHGSALRKNCAVASKVAEAVVNIASKKNIPVSIKTRLGWQDHSDLIEFGLAMESVGVSGITIHGRTYQDAFSGLARWEPIYELKKALKIPVIGNGDINSGNKAVQMINNLDGVMVGRSTFGNPWLMGQIAETLIGKSNMKNEFFDPNIDYEYFPNKIPVIILHAQKLFAYKGVHGIFEFRKILLTYIRGFNNAKNYRQEIVSIESVDDLIKIINKILINEFNSEPINIT